LETDERTTISFLVQMSGWRNIKLPPGSRFMANSVENMMLYDTFEVCKSASPEL
jgi:hypothetical protein